MTHDQVKAALDLTSVGVILGALLDYLPYVAAVLPIIYWIIRIAETDTARKTWRRLWRRVG